MLETVFTALHRLSAEAALAKDFAAARGDALPRELTVLLADDSLPALECWKERMDQMVGSVTGALKEPYLLTSGRAFAAACLVLIRANISWETLDFQRQREASPQLRLDSIHEISALVDRLHAQGEKVIAAKTVLLWCKADAFYRQGTPVERQWSHRDIATAWVQESRKDPTLAAVLRPA